MWIFLHQNGAPSGDICYFCNVIARKINNLSV